MVALKRNRCFKEELCAPAADKGELRPGGAPCRCSGARQMRLERIRREIENGTYETEGKLRIAITRLIDDVLGRRPRGRC